VCFSPVHKSLLWLGSPVRVGGCGEGVGYQLQQEAGSADACLPGCRAIRECGYPLCAVVGCAHAFVRVFARAFVAANATTYPKCVFVEFNDSNTDQFCGASALGIANVPPADLEACLPVR
jgi:hypothetical protein